MTGSSEDLVGVVEFTNDEAVFFLRRRDPVICDVFVPLNDVTSAMQRKVVAFSQPMIVGEKVVVPEHGFALLGTDH